MRFIHDRQIFFVKSFAQTTAAAAAARAHVTNSIIVDGDHSNDGTRVRFFSHEYILCAARCRLHVEDDFIATSCTFK